MSRNEFKPNKSPKEVFQEGSFGGTYFRPIYSSVTKRNYTSNQVIKEYPKSWFKDIDIQKMVTSPEYDKDINKYKVKCGSSLEMWEENGWIGGWKRSGQCYRYCITFCSNR